MSLSRATAASMNLLHFVRLHYATLRSISFTAYVHYKRAAYTIFDAIFPECDTPSIYSLNFHYALLHFSFVRFMSRASQSQCTKNNSSKKRNIKSYEIKQHFDSSKKINISLCFAAQISPGNDCIKRILRNPLKRY